MPLSSFPSIPAKDISTSDLADVVARVIKEVNYLLNGGLDTLNVNELSADVINAGTLNAALVTVQSALSSGASIVIDSNGMRINDGTRDVFVADINGKVTMTGAKVQSSEEYPKVELSSDGNVFSAYVDETHYIQILPDVLGGAQIKFVNDTKEVTHKLFNSGVGGYVYMLQSDGDIQLSSSNDIVSNPTRYHRFSSWSKIYSTGEGSTLLTELNNIKSRLTSLESRVTALEAKP